MLHSSGYLSPSTQVDKTFETLEAGEDWLRENEPGMIAPARYRRTGEGWKHYGTDYYWATFTKAPATL